jgi:hypothetical protein
VEGENLQELVKKQAETIQPLEARIVELEDYRPFAKEFPQFLKAPFLGYSKTKDSRGERKRGRPGHTKRERAPFSRERAGQFVEVPLSKRPACACLLEEDERGVITNRQIEMAAKPFVATECRRHTYWRPVCQACHTVPAPEQARGGLFSISPIAFAAYVKGGRHISFSAPSDFFQGVGGCG